MRTPQPLRVLLVDDDPDLLAMLEVVVPGPTLEVVGLASNGEDAVRVASTIQPDVAVVDYMMPGIDGFETASRIKAVCPRCSILIFSALDLALECAEHPDVDRFLRKSDVGRLDDMLADIESEHRTTR
jgi:CheY-like chemotaxis protein